LFVEDGIDAAGGALDDAGALERIRQQRIARTRLGDEQVVEAHALRKAAGIGDLDAVLVPLNVDRAESGVVAVDQRVGDPLAEGGGRIVGHRDSQHADQQLLLAVARAESRQQLVHDAQQRPAEEVVDLDLLRRQRLEGDFMSRQQPAQRLFAAEEQEPEHAHRRYVIVGLHRAQCLGQLEIGEVHQARVAPALALAHEAAKALDLERVEVLPTGIRQRERGVVEQAALGLLRLHLVEVHRQARRPPVAAERPAHVPAVRRPNR
jgi:hypothetical protein